MTENQFIKYSFKHSEIIEFTQPEIPGYKSNKVDCLLLGVDFEQKLFKLLPINSEDADDFFWSRIEYCHKPKFKIKK